MAPLTDARLRELIRHYAAPLRLYACQWTREPDDVVQGRLLVAASTTRGDTKDPLARIARYDGRQWLAATCDGSVHMLKADILADAVLALFGMSDGKDIPSGLFR